VAKLIHEKYQPNLTLEHLKYEGKVTKSLMLLDLYDIGEVNKDFLLKIFNQMVKSGKIHSDESSEQLLFEDSISNSQTKIKLTEAEESWIKNNPVISFTGDPNWLPYEAFNKDGRYIGIVSDYLKLIEQKSGLTFKPLPVSSWTESLQVATEGKVSVISGDSADDILNQTFNPVDAYSHNPIVIIMHSEQNYVEKLQELKGKKIAIIKDYGYTADIYKQYPDFKFIEVENIQEGLEGVSQGRFDTMLATMALASYHITDMGIHNIKVVGKTPIIMDLTLFVDKAQPLLHSIINKSLNSIENIESQTILQKWGKSQYVEKINYQLILQVTTLLLIILALSIFWNRKLQNEIKSRLQIEADLRKSDERYKNFDKHSKEGVYRIDFILPVPINLPTSQMKDWINENAIIGDCNEALTQMYGLEVQDMIGHKATEFAPDYAVRAIEIFKNNNYHVSNIETVDVDKNGKRLYLLEDYHGIIEDGKLLSIWGAQTNITQRIKAEFYSKKTAEILEMFTTGRPSAEIYDSIALMYEQRHPGMRCSLLELQDGVLLHGGAPSMPQEYCAAIHGLKNGPEVASCGTSTYTGKRCLVENIETDPKWANIKEVALPHGMRSCWSEPIINSKGEVMDALL